MMQLDPDKKALIQTDLSNHERSKSTINTNDQLFNFLDQEEDQLDSNCLDLRKVNEYILHILDNQQIKIAQDIHDSIGQELYSLRLFIDALEFYQSDQAEFNKALHSVQSMLDSTLQTVRSISKNLNPLFATENNLIQPVRLLVDQINEIKPFHIEFNYNSNEVLFNDESHLIHVYRILQEFITNSLKHSEAQKIILYIYYADDKLDISIHDNGVGFNIHSSRDTCGITNIFNRLNALDSQIEFTSTIGYGTQLNFTLNGKCNFTSIS